MSGVISSLNDTKWVPEGKRLESTGLNQKCIILANLQQSPDVKRLGLISKLRKRAIKLQRKNTPKMPIELSRGEQDLKKPITVPLHIRQFQSPVFAPGALL